MSMMNTRRLMKLIDGWIPEAIREQEEQKLRARVILLMMLICSSSVGLVGLAILLGILLGAQPLWDGVIGAFGVSLMWYGGIVFFRKTKSLEKTCHLFAFIMYSSTLGALLTSGGWSSPIHFLLLAVPAGIFLVAGREVGLFWAIVSALTYLMLWVLHRNGVNLLQIVRPEHRDYLTMGMWCFSAFIMVGCLTVYDRMSETLKESLRREREGYRQRVMMDSLSGFYNRQGLQKLTEQSFQRQEDVLLVYFNIANLSLINSEIHYQAGDELIREVSTAVNRHFPQAILSRITGGEFAVLLPGVSTEEMAQELCDAIQEILSASFLLTETQQEIRVHAGVGGAWSPYSRSRDFRQLLRRGHELMQQSLDQGRGCVLG